jgi:hypothetical protein
MLGEGGGWEEGVACLTHLEELVEEIENFGDEVRTGGVHGR